MTRNPLRSKRCFSYSDMGFIRGWILYTTACHGVTCSAISQPASSSVRRSSEVSCRFNQSCGVVPKYLASRTAVSALTPRWPLRGIVTRFHRDAKGLRQRIG